MTLALEYRPRTLDDFNGQRHVVYIVRRMLDRWRLGELTLPTGIILAGNHGSGKTSLARVIAASLNCESESGTRPCQQCTQCKAIYNFTSDAVYEIDGATSGLVDDIRELQRLARLSHSGVYRVIVVDECHAMSKEAFSALLKQLEEPPPNVLYVLVTTDLHMVPLTIRSRCLQFIYASISEDDIASRLAYVCDQEHFTYEPEVLKMIARRSSGAMRDALMMLEQLAIIDGIDATNFRSLWPDGLDKFAAEFMESVYAQDHVRGMEIVHRAFTVYRDSNLMTDAIITFIKNKLAQDVNSSSINRMTLRRSTAMISAAWDLRVRLNQAPPTNPGLVEGLWFIFTRELGQTGSGASRVTSRPLELATTLSDAGQQGDGLKVPELTLDLANSESSVEDDVLKALMLS